MFDKLQPYLCLIVILYILGCLVHDIWIYHGIRVENNARFRRDTHIKEALSRELDNLIELIEEEHLDNKKKDRLKNIKNSLNE